MKKGNFTFIDKIKFAIAMICYNIYKHIEDQYTGKDEK